MRQESEISLFELVTGLSDAVDLVIPSLVNHHKQVAYITFCLGLELQLSMEDVSQLIVAGALHDIGALSLRERLEALEFEIEHPYQHAETGYHLLKIFSPFSKIADIVRFHHVSWNNGEGKLFRGIEVPFESHILHLADRVAVLIDQRHEVLSQVHNISERIERQSNKMFCPRVVDAFRGLTSKEYFWLDCVSQSIGSILGKRIKSKIIELDLDAILDIAQIFSHIIDFRCEFTSNHSSGVAACSQKLAGYMGFSERECRMMKVAGYLHDLGKLAIPLEILKKPSKLTDEEYQVIKSHAYYTYRTLETLKGFETINPWASFHHECLNGSGYPFHLNEADLSLGSRIMAVADVFTALTEDRPYRKGMDKTNVLQILQQMTDQGKLDSSVVSILKNNFEEVNLCRLSVQEAANDEYRRLLEQSGQVSI